LLCIELEGADSAPKLVLPTLDQTTAKMSREEELLRERLRMTITGITSFEYDASTSTFVFPMAGALYTLTLLSTDPLGVTAPVKLQTSATGAQMDAKICFDQPDLVSFVRSGNLWLTRRSTGIEVQLSDVQWHDGCKVAAGTPSYVLWCHPSVGSRFGSR
jgi:hypothetical protein